MTEWLNATQKQLNYIQVLLKENMTPDAVKANLYFKARDLKPEDFSKGEASGLIEMFNDGRSTMAMKLLKHRLKGKK